MVNQIQVTATMDADTKKVWDYYALPEHITKWNFADPGWHCPTASNDMRVVGDMWHDLSLRSATNMASRNFI